MRVIGVIAEFNPFHNGHEYLIAKAREAVGDPRAIVAVCMSGSFVQRGEPSILPKDIRTKMALNCGADVVFELPFSFACAPSERFAHGGVELLARTGVVTDIAFGVDSNPELISFIADAIFENANDSNEEYSRILSEALSGGKSFAAARSEAILGVLFEGASEDSPMAKSIPFTKSEISDALMGSNSILAVDYLLAMKRMRLTKKIQVHMISRVGGDYLDTEIRNEFASATSIRKALWGASDVAEASNPAFVATQIAKQCPSAALAVWLSRIGDLESAPSMMTNYNRLVDGAIATRITSATNIDSAYMNEHLWGYIKNSFEAAQSAMHQGGERIAASRNFTKARIDRALASITVGQNSSDIELISHVNYLRVLGMNRDGRYCLKIIKKVSKLPLIHNCSDFLELNSLLGTSEYYEATKRCYELDLAANELQSSLLGLPRDYEWSVPPVCTK